MKVFRASIIVIAVFFVYGSSAQITKAELDRSVEDNTIIESTEGSENHKTLLAAVKAADLEETLDSDGPFTVFAPSDVAFKKLSKEKITALLQPENKKELKSVLSYHIVAGNLTASKILKAMCRGSGTARFTTIQGDEITASMDGIDIVLTDCYGNSARITTADANQCNGVIHVIDSVIMPNRT
ncbi:MAG: fasciclin domain-containing protein [Eudoraea sp.]|nr:fasciclin domain-containing protein [Eudoraea sp.]